MASIAPNEKEKKRPFAFLQSKKNGKGLQKSDSKSDDGTDTVVAKTGKDDPKEAVHLVPFFSLYRFHKPHEILLNLIGVVCAIASGAAQVCFFKGSSNAEVLTFR